MVDKSKIKKLSILIIIFIGISASIAVFNTNTNNSSNTNASVDIDLNNNTNSIESTIVESENVNYFLMIQKNTRKKPIQSKILKPTINESTTLNINRNLSGTIQIIAVTGNNKSKIVDEKNYNFSALEPNAMVRLDVYNDSKEVEATVLRNENVKDFDLINNEEETPNKSSNKIGSKAGSVGRMTADGNLKNNSNRTVSVIAIMPNDKRVVLDKINYDFSTQISNNITLNSIVDVDINTGESASATVIKNKDNISNFILKTSNTSIKNGTNLQVDQWSERSIFNLGQKGTVQVIANTSDGKKVKLKERNYNYSTKTPDATVDIEVNRDSKRVTATILRNINVEDFEMKDNNGNHPNEDSGGYKFNENVSAGGTASMTASGNLENNDAGIVSVIGIMSDGSKKEIESVGYDFSN